MRRRIEAPVDREWQVHSFLIASDNSFVRLFWGESAFAITEAAREAWPQCRRQVWDRTNAGILPRGAAIFDGLSDDGQDAATWHCSPGEVLAAVTRDREKVRRFEARKPAAAREIAESLARWCGVLDALADRARQRAEAVASGEPWWRHR